MVIFGCVGLVLVTIGVYSVLAYTTARRTHEIGIRLALGAERGDVLGLVIRTGLRLVLGGIGVGLLVSLGIGANDGRAAHRCFQLTIRLTLAGTTVLAGGDGSGGVLDSSAARGARGARGGVAIRVKANFRLGQQLNFA